MPERFARSQRLPPYVFSIVHAMKVEARRRGEEIIDLGMGNPDRATPCHIVDKLIEEAQKSRNHRYSASKGITKLRTAICDGYKKQYGVDLDPETEAVVTIGSKEGLSQPALATIEQGDAVLTTTPAYPIHPYSVNIAVSPGIGFGEYGDHSVRFALIENEQRLRQAARGIRQALNS